MATVRRIALTAALFACLHPLHAQAPSQTPTQAKIDPKKDPDQIGNRDVGKGINLYSIEKEIALGKQMAQQVEQSARVIDHPRIAEFVSRVGQNLVRNSDSKVPFTIKLIEGEEINALSLPGGYFFVNTGLILAASTEAEMAGAMAHEIAHIAARHGTRQASRSEIAQLATIPLIFMGGGWIGYGARQAAGVIVPTTFLAFSRGFENEADLLGIQYLYKSGYDPEGMVDIFEKIHSLEKRAPGKVSKLFSTHPPTGERIVQVQRHIQSLLKEQPQYIVNTSEFDEVKAELENLLRRRKGDPVDPNRPTLRKKLAGD